MANTEDDYGYVPRLARSPLNVERDPIRRYNELLMQILLERKEVCPDDDEQTAEERRQLVDWIRTLPQGAIPDTLND